MKQAYTRVFLLAAVAFAFFASVSAQNGAVLAEARRVSGDDFPIAVKTKKGANVYAVHQPSRATLDAIDQGLTDLFVVARRNGYDRKLNYTEYSIFIAKADRQKDADGNYSPGIAVGAAQYAGTEYDKGGYIYAAGMVIARNPMAFVIAEHTSNLDRVAEIVRFEGEHLVLYHNDRRRYEETKDHSRGGGHPILR